MIGKEYYNYLIIEVLTNVIICQDDEDQIKILIKEELSELTLVIKKDWTWKDLEDGDLYAYISDKNLIEETYWHNSTDDLFRAKSGNTYQTSYEAYQAFCLIKSKE